MSRKLYASALAAAVLGLAGMSVQAAGFADMAATPTALLGSTLAPQAGAPTIDLSSGKSYINVRHGETVNFSANGQVFAVRFNGVRQSFDLNALAPAGALNRTIKVYVSPRYENDLS